MTDADAVLAVILEGLPADVHGPLVLRPTEMHVPLALVENPDWLAEQIRLRAERWNTDDARTLATLWWYSASAWLIGPTVSSLVLGGPVLSADVDALTIHWLPDSRVTGATSSRVCDATSRPIEAASATLRRMYERVIPAVAAQASIAPRPLWGIATDALAARLLALGRALDDVAATTDLLEPLIEAIGAPMPRGRYQRVDDGMAERRCSCCLLYLAPAQSKCGNCPRRRATARRPPA